MQLEISIRNIVFTPFELTVNSHLDYIYNFTSNFLRDYYGSATAPGPEYECITQTGFLPPCEVGLGCLRIHKCVGRGEVRLGNSIYSEHDSKDILVTYRVCEDEPTRICDRTVCYGENVEWRKPIGGSNSAL